MSVRISGMEGVSKAEARPRASSRRHVLHVASIELFILVGAAVVAVIFVEALRGDVVAVDFWQFRAAAESIIHGHDPYDESFGSTALWGGPYPYPPLPALLAMPLTLVSFKTAGLLVMGTLVLVALAVPYVLGVRDWRCYGIMLAWPCTISAIQTGNVTLWFALAAAVAWRLRERRLSSAVAIGFTLAVKFYMWPLVIWLAVTRRIAAAALAVAVGAALVLASWATIGFAGLTAYPGLVRQLEATVGEDSYTVYVVGLDVGLPSALARALWLATGLALLALMVGVARRGAERSAFALAVAASLALTPIVWLHYFALLIVVVALTQPRLSAAWFVPLAFVLTPGSGHPTPFETVWTLAIAAATVALALRGVDVGRRLRPEAAPAVVGR